MNVRVGGWVGGGGGGESKSRRSPPGKSKQLFLAVWGIFLLLFSFFWGPFTPHVRAFLLHFSPYGDIFSMCGGGGAYLDAHASPPFLHLYPITFIPIPPSSPLLHHPSIESHDYSYPPDLHRYSNTNHELRAYTITVRNSIASFNHA